MTSLADIGRDIRTMRRSRGLTQQQLAELVGLERTSITNIEAGNQSVPVPKLGAICAALGYELVLTFRPAGATNRDLYR